MKEKGRTEEQACKRAESPAFCSKVFFVPRQAHCAYLYDEDFGFPDLLGERYEYLIKPFVDTAEMEGR